MTISTNEHAEASQSDPGGGILADTLTFLRIAVTPLIIALILWRWPDTQVAILASVLFIVAALTDIFDDFFGGPSRSAARRYGYLDDVADTILIVGCLLALSVVLWLNGLFGWGFAVPASIIVIREVLIGVTKGYELSRYGWPDNIWSNLKGAFAMLGTALLVSSPWLTQWLDMSRASGGDAFGVYNAASPLVWILGQLALWIAAVFSLISGYRILTHKRGTDTV